MRRCRYVLAVLYLLAFMSGCGGGLPLPPLELPKPPAKPPAVEPEKPCAELALPWCDEVGLTCGACKHQPPSERCAIPAPPCPPAKPPVVEPPAQVGCSIDGEPGLELAGHVQVHGAAVNDALRAVTGQDGGRIVVGEGRQAFQARVIAELRRRGLCAGQHAADTDEIAVASSPTSPREGFHVYAGPAAGPGTVVLSPQADRGAYAAPTSSPANPPAASSSCPAPLPLRVYDDGVTAHWFLKCHAHVPREVIDCTPTTIGQEPFCRAIGMSPMADGTLRGGCPPRPDGHPDRPACEAFISGGGFRLEARDGARCEFYQGNPLQFLAVGGGCRLCSVDGTVCSNWF